MQGSSEEYRFNDLAHFENFLCYMFISTPFQAKRHSDISGYVYVGGKIYEYGADHPTTVMKDRKKAKDIFLKKEFNAGVDIPKSLIIYPENSEDEGTFKLFKEVVDILEQFEQEPNIINVCAATHYKQREDAHIHVFYTCHEDIDNEIIDFFIKHINVDSAPQSNEIDETTEEVMSEVVSSPSLPPVPPQIPKPKPQKKPPLPKPTPSKEIASPQEQDYNRKTKLTPDMWFDYLWITVWSCILVTAIIFFGYWMFSTLLSI